MSGHVNAIMARGGNNSDPIASAIFDALAEGEKCICELKEAIGIPQTWESYDIRMLEDLKVIESRTASGHKFYSLSPGRALWYLRRSLAREERKTPSNRLPVNYRSAIEQVRLELPVISELEGVLRRGL